MYEDDQSDVNYTIMSFFLQENQADPIKITKLSNAKVHGVFFSWRKLSKLWLILSLLLKFSLFKNIFVFSPGSRNQKAYKAIEDIGPAVLQGGFSTFLALLPLAFTDSHLFQAFFKVNLTFLPLKYSRITLSFGNILPNSTVPCLHRLPPLSGLLQGKSHRPPPKI